MKNFLSLAFGHKIIFSLFGFGHIFFNALASPYIYID